MKISEMEFNRVLFICTVLGKSPAWVVCMDYRGLWAEYILLVFLEHPAIDGLTGLFGKLVWKFIDISTMLFYYSDSSEELSWSQLST